MTRSLHSECRHRALITTMVLLSCLASLSGQPYMEHCVNDHVTFTSEETAPYNITCRGLSPSDDVTWQAYTVTDGAQPTVTTMLGGCTGGQCYNRTADVQVTRGADYAVLQVQTLPNYIADRTRVRCKIVNSTLEASCFVRFTAATTPTTLSSAMTTFETHLSAASASAAVMTTLAVTASSAVTAPSTVIPSSAITPLVMSSTTTQLLIAELTSTLSTMTSHTMMSNMPQADTEPSSTSLAGIIAGGVVAAVVVVVVAAVVCWRCQSRSHYATPDPRQEAPYVNLSPDQAVGNGSTDTISSNNNHQQLAGVALTSHGPEDDYYNTRPVPATGGRRETSLNHNQDVMANGGSDCYTGSDSYTGADSYTGVYSSLQVADVGQSPYSHLQVRRP